MVGTKTHCNEEQEASWAQLQVFGFETIHKLYDICNPKKHVKENSSTSMLNPHPFQFFPVFSWVPSLLSPPFRNPLKRGVDQPMRPAKKPWRVAEPGRYVLASGDLWPTAWDGGIRWETGGNFLPILGDFFWGNLSDSKRIGSCFHESRRSWSIYLICSGCKVFIFSWQCSRRKTHLSPRENTCFNNLFSFAKKKRLHSGQTNLVLENPPYFL